MQDGDDVATAGVVITLTTDFGQRDPYLAAMKGAILSINPRAVIVDISHSIEAGNIAEAAFVVGGAYKYFPKGTIHVVVVDPGVGSKRKAVILETPPFFFAAPDNGVLSYVVDGKGEISPPLRAVSLSEPRFWRHEVSSTFHGRDIFAPVAAHLSLGTPLGEFGEEIRSLFAFPISHPRWAAKGELVGHIVYIDHFGNLITDIKDEDLPGKEVAVKVSGRCIDGLSRSYAEGGDLLALIDSSGYLEVAARNADASQLLGAKLGDEIRVSMKRGR